MTAASLLRAITNRATNVALDAASYAIAAVCDSCPRLDERRQIHQLRMKLYDAYVRIADLEEVVKDYRATHEMQHGSTLPSLTEALDLQVPKDLN